MTSQIDVEMLRILLETLANVVEREASTPEVAVQIIRNRAASLYRGYMTNC